MLESAPKCIAMDAEAKDQIVPRDRFGAANGATYETLAACPPIALVTLDALGRLLPHRRRLGGERPRVGPPAIGVQGRDAKRLSQGFALHKDRLLPPSQDGRPHGATVVIDRVPPPSGLRFLAHRSPHLLELCGQATTLRELVSAAELALYLLGG
jgi:hypothetical protein